MQIGRAEITMFIGQFLVILFWGLFMYFGDVTNASTERKNEIESSEVIH